MVNFVRKYKECFAIIIDIKTVLKAQGQAAMRVSGTGMYEKYAG